MADDEEDVSKVAKVSEVSNDVDNEVVEGEVVDGEAADLNPAADEANLVLTLEGTIKNHMAQIANLREELGKQREMLKASFENDPTYIEHDTTAKDAAKIRSKTKAEILKKPDIAELAAKVKSMTSEFKDLQSALSDYLREFNRVSGLTEIEGQDGELLEIVYVAKLVKKPRT